VATATPTPTATPTATPGLVGNVSTRLPVGQGDDALFEGFIVLGPEGSAKKILVRAIGPSLVPFGVSDALPDPTLEIHDQSGATIATNNDWQHTQIGGLITGDQSGEISASHLAPGNQLESAIIANLAPGSYTAVVRGLGTAPGTGVVDAYDLSGATPARLANISTRGLIQPDDKLMIAGFIVQNAPVRAAIRAVGPSLLALGINNALPDTTLQLRDKDGAIVLENDDWQDDPAQKQELENIGLQPSHNREAALVTTIPPGQYTAQVRGKGNARGIGVVQVYFLE
jgi:dUTPase